MFMEEVTQVMSLQLARPKGFSRKSSRRQNMKVNPSKDSFSSYQYL